MAHVVTAEGQIILPGAMLHAVHGPHAGTHWRLEKVHHNGEHHVLRCTRLLRRVGRVVMDFHPSVFGLNVIEMKRWYRLGRDDLRRFLGKIDDGLFMGILALIPLAAFEAFHGSEHFHALVMMIMGGGD